MSRHTISTAALIASAVMTGCVERGGSEREIRQLENALAERIVNGYFVELKNENNRFSIR